MNYKDVMRITDSDWRTQAGNFMAAGADFIVIGIATEQDLKDCQSCAQEHDYTCVVEDRGEDRDLVVNNYPAVLPKRLGFTHRSKLKPIVG